MTRQNMNLSVAQLDDLVVIVFGPSVVISQPRLNINVQKYIIRNRAALLCLYPPFDLSIWNGDDNLDLTTRVV